MEINSGLYKFLDWDSEFFGVRIGRIKREILTPEIWENARQWCSDNKIDCLYFLADLSDAETTVLAEKNGFHFTDIRMTLETKLRESANFLQKAEVLIQHAALEDVKQLKKIASINHRDSRFYYDGNFSVKKCDELFAVWIEKSVNGFADAVLVAKSEDRVDGYITCSVEGNGTGSIGLVGVGDQARGRGIGRHLVGTALEWFKSQNVFYVTVVTQGRNLKAQRLYQNNGFVTESLKNWYHLWFR